MTRSTIRCALLAVALCGGLTHPAAAAQAAPTTTPAPAANPADVASMDAIIAALYDVISGPAGKKRNWNRMRSLFAPGARLIPIGPRQDGEIAPRVLDVESYITTSGPYLESNGFFEREAGRRADTSGHIVHVFSAYEARHKTEDPEPFVRGTNSIQLVNDGKRWWVITVLWEAEAAPPAKVTEKTSLRQR
jgi:hypothetical protein